ncbi:9909_t:CDS:1, partial [Cetraspora pellucida]
DNKNVFDSIFAETHSKLECLNNKISKLQDIYLTNNDLDKKSDNKANEFIDNKASSESLVIYIDNFFTANQIKCFYKIYMLYSIHIVIKDKKIHDKRLDKQDNNAFLVKLQQFVCCIKRCFSNINP